MLNLKVCKNAKQNLETISTALKILATLVILAGPFIFSLFGFTGIAAAVLGSVGAYYEAHQQQQIYNDYVESTRDCKDIWTANKCKRKWNKGKCNKKKPMVMENCKKTCELC